MLNIPVTKMITGTTSTCIPIYLAANLLVHNNTIKTPLNLANTEASLITQFNR